ncbi:hypothetical protein E4O04_04825 [Treponema sp. OMZ 799]|uniref:hypothetical protein n=1 Tax=Treponema sp. OMZ 799 TaxID=2563668 RepID=UPI0020A29C59|nr:hypothetical protein [Treponema sp. OMZ 799]UTC77360.1 hypothetical protein E4O04_04825 [Treponema sp. OMZ 799]
MKHKNFVSMAALLILVLSAVFLVTACPTGTGPSSGSNSGGTLTPPAVSAEETELTALLGKISLDKTIITAASESITISNLPSVPEVRADIASNNIELIEYEAPNQLKVKALPTETADVKITITLTKNGISKSRDFTVKVFKSGDTPTEDDYFNTLTIPTTVSDDFDLPKELKNTESTAITWSTENENIIKIENSGTNPKALIAFDIVERKVKLTATASGKIKAFEVTVLPVVKIEIKGGSNDKKVYEFTQNGITIKEFQDDKLLRGNLYSYTLDDTNKQITVRLTSIFSPEGNKWFTIEEYYSLMTDMNITALKNLLEGIDALLSKPTISIAETKEVLKNFSHEDMSGYTDEEFFNKFLKDALGIEYNEFTALSPQEQTEKIKAILIGLKKEKAKQFGLPEDASTEDILAEFKKQFQQQAAQQIKEAKEPCTYSYSIRKDSEGKLYFGTTEVYNPSKAWYENRGHWDYHPEYTPSENTWISNLSAHKIPDGTIGAFLSIQEKQGGSYNHKGYKGSITGSGPDYTFNGSREDNPGEQITATITDNKDGTITVTVTEGGSASSRLKFEGNSLLIWR